MTTGILKDLPTLNDQKQGWPWVEETSKDVYSQTNSWPKITIVTPSYQQGQFLEETIRSVLLQNYPNLEYIVIDGGSTDNSVEIIRKYEPWLSYWVSEKDRGQSHAINKGLDRATGEIIQWINSDDVLRANALLEVSEQFLSNPDGNCLIAPTWAFGQNDRVLAPTPVFPNLRRTVSAARINQPGTFFRAEAFRVITPLKEELHYMMDLHMWLRYLLLFGPARILYSKQLLVNFREHPASKTVSSEALFFKDRFRLLDSLQRFLQRGEDKEGLFYGIKAKPAQKKEFLYGINDCLLYWWKLFRAKGNREMEEHLRCIVNANYLTGSDKFRYYWMKLR
jgi:glycosyltransferase involved in cell wall biosynthesis